MLLYCVPASVRIEHWDVAMDQGRVAALNMLDKQVIYETVPFFWTAQFGMSLRYAGHANQFDDIIVDGDLTAKRPKFTAYFVQDEKIAAVATFNNDPQAVAALELLREGKMPSAEEIRVERTIDLTLLL